MGLHRCCLFAVASLIAASSVGACTSFSADTTTSSSEAGTDGGAEAGGVNLLRDPSFELPGCSGPWSSNGARVVDDSAPRSGQRSCRVCGQAGQSVWDVSQDVQVGPIAPGATYVGDAWVRALADGTAPPPVSIRVSTRDGTGVTLEGVESSSLGTFLDATWSHIVVSLPVTKPGATGLQVNVIARDVGGCFLVDDATLMPLP